MKAKDRKCLVIAFGAALKVASVSQDLAFERIPRLKFRAKITYSV
jgi:hypothetical protein